MTTYLTTHNQEGTKAKQIRLNKFIVFVRTNQFLNLRYKGNDKPIPVHIPQKKIESDFFKYPEFNRKECLKNLVDAGELKIHSNGSYFTYEALDPGSIDLSLIKPKADNFNNEVISMIRNDLKFISLKPGAPSTDYFDAFLKYKDQYIKLFFTVDQFARRIHTPVTNFHREYRNNLLFHNSEVASFDVATMQPLLLGKILLSEIGENEYSDWINSGEDIYIMLQEKANLKTRDEAKKRFFEILFAPASNSLADMFGASDWINWINKYKRSIIQGNPHNNKKRYSNLAWKLQTTEVKIMYKVWKLLYEHDIPFLTIHDEILVRIQDGTNAERLFSQVLLSSFTYYKLNSKINQQKKESGFIEI